VARSGLKAMDGVIAASNRLVLIAPERILECVDRIHTLLEDPRPRDDGWAADWIDARGELLQVARVFVPSA
jgi:hypothetical protein